MAVDLTLTGDIQALRLGPNDALIVRVNRTIDQREANELREALATLLPPNTRFLVVGSDIEFSVAGRAEESQWLT
jgi:hypothetical protein